MSRRGLSWAASIGVIAALGAGAYALTRNAGDDVVELTSDGFAQLAERPLDLPRHLASDDGCELATDSWKLPGIPGEAALAPLPPGELPERPTGPIFTKLGEPPRTLGVLDPPSRDAWGITESLWISDQTYRGPILVRDGRLDGRSRIRFGGGKHPKLELRLGEGEWTAGEEVRHFGQLVRPRRGWRVANAVTRFRATGCYAFQVDGKGFSYTLPFSATFLSGE